MARARKDLRSAEVLVGRPELESKRSVNLSRSEEALRGLTRYWVASGEWISGVSSTTAADRAVVDDVAFRIQTAGSGARVLALLVDAGLAQGTFRAHGAFRSTTWRSSYIVRKTGAHCLFVDFTTLTVRTARRGVTRINRRDFDRYKRKDH